MNLKHTLTLILLGTAFLGFSQRPQDQDIDFNYTQLPATPLDQSIQNYFAKVNLLYTDKINAEKAIAQKEYDQAMAEYPELERQAKERYNQRLERYNKEKEAYDNKSAGKKFIEKNVLEENTKPTHPGSYYPPSKPYLREVKSQKVFNEEMLANSYLKLEGFNQSIESALKITVDLYGFEYTEPQYKSESKKMYNSKTKSNYYKNYSWYETSYKHPINLKIETPDGQILFNETFSHFSEMKVISTAKTEGSRQNMNRESYIKMLEDKAVTDNLKEINDFINDNYGFRTVQRKTEIFTVKEKKHTYQDYKLAYISASEGYGKLVSEPEVGIKKLNEAIAMWETALEESDVENKKARINEKVTLVTYYNLADAYIHTNQFDKANNVMNQLMLLSDKRNEIATMDAYKAHLADMKERWENNNN